MLTPPDGLPEGVLASALRRGWAATAASIAYRPVGFGSHHWEVADAAGHRWFVTADELEYKRRSAGESLDAAFGRLRASLAAASDLRECGCTFVVAPVPALDGEPLVRANDQFGVAMYPFVRGQSFEWGAFTPQHRRGLLELIIALHTAPGAASRRACADDFAIPHRDGLEAVLGSAAAARDCGPYARPAALLLASYAAPIQRVLARYDHLVAAGRARPARRVLTHGEPHPGNAMLTAEGWMLVDWDTALMAPPERDLWTLDPGHGSTLSAYADATGSRPLASMLELYRLRWDLADIAIDLSRFRRPHRGSLDDEKSWKGLRDLVVRLSS